MNIKRWLIVAVVLAALVVTLKLTVFKPEVIRVRIATVERGVVEETVTNTRAGTVKVYRRAKLSPQIGGLVVATPFLEGSLVSAGDLLLKLDDRMQQAELDPGPPERRRRRSPGRRGVFRGRRSPRPSSTGQPRCTTAASPRTRASTP